MKKYILPLICQLLVVSCGNSAYENALLKSGKNRSELERVVSHYDALYEQEKKAAAVFLIENMIGKQSLHFRDKVAHEKLLRYLCTVDDPIGWDPMYSTISRTMDSIVNVYPQTTSTNNDLETITTNYLINNIDLAFEAWYKTPWNKDYTFEEFREYVLPYKIDREELDNWRKSALENRSPAEDSILKNGGTVWDLAVALVNNTGLYYNIGIGRYPFPMNYGDLNMLRRGACGQMADLALYYFRSRGIPSANDFIPAWANRSSSHVWNAIILPNGRSRSIGYRPDGTNDLAYKVSKIYRRTYKIQPPIKCSKIEVLPAFLSNRNVMDVTAQYDMPLSDVEVELTKDAKVENVYLATFNNNSWIAIAQAEKKSNGAKFQNLGRGSLPKGTDNMIRYMNQGNGIVYLPVYSLNKGLASAGGPFILDTLGNIHKLCPSDKKTNVRLYRKYPKHPKLVENEEALVGSVFEVANRADFSDAKTIYTIASPQQYPLQRVTLNASTRYRYIRFKPTEAKETQVAELQFYNSKGERISVRSKDNNKAFDGNILTSHNKKANYSESIVGDFITPQQISQIAFSARTDDNEVMKGEEYELLYWDDKWISLGRKVADNYYLDYPVPENSLLWLRNHIKGIEERIFMIKNGTQIWW